LTKVIEDSVEKIPVIKYLARIAKKIPIPGLQGMSLYDILELYILGIVRGALTSRAGSIAFSFFLALFPFLLFILTLIPYVPIEGFQDDFLGMVETMLPPKTSEAVDGVISDIINNKYSGLLSFGFIMSMFLMTNGVNAIFGGFEYTYHKIKTRSIIRMYLVAFGTSLVLALLLIFSVAVIIEVQIGIAQLEQHDFVNDSLFWMRLARTLIVGITLLVGVSLLFYVGTREGKHLNFFSAGAIFTTIFFAVNFYFFGIYVTKFATYNKLYGSIGTLLILMLFVWLNSIILLLGFELNTSILRCKKIKST
jgi:membrane protein